MLTLKQRVLDALEFEGESNIAGRAVALFARVIHDPGAVPRTSMSLMNLTNAMIP